MQRAYLATDATGGSRRYDRQIRVGVLAMIEAATK